MHESTIVSTIKTTQKFRWEFHSYIEHNTTLCVNNNNNNNTNNTKKKQWKNDN